jgi:hypothetical protein
MRKTAVCLGIALLAAATTGRAQLAITETFSSAATNNTLLAASGDQGPDFWELTNFGTNSVDLTGYRFNDSDAVLGGDADSTTMNGVIIAPGESVIFAQNNTAINTRDLFISWWGAENLPTNLQVFFYSGNGQSSSGDSIVVWDAAAVSDADYLDRADYGEASRGHSFTYDTNTAVFGIVSSNGVNGAFTAVTAADVGSPGRAPGPVALAITAQPTNATGYIGFPVTFQAAARGLPRPHYQWLFNGNPIDGEKRSALTITNVEAASAGTYSVSVGNGIQTIASSNAVLTVDSAPSAPVFVTRPRSVDAYVGQTVTLGVQAQGNPAPSYQWRSNNVVIAGQNSSTLVLANLQTNYTATYAVFVSNLVGTNSATAAVTVTTKPKLFITEAHSTGSAAPAPGGQDWWELTNLGGFPVKLRDCRFDDSSGSLSTSLTFTNDITILPGESIVLVENMPAAQFRTWWGLPDSVKVASYGGVSGLGFSSSGDGIFFWNAAATVDSDYICGVSFSSSSQTAPRRSFVWDPDSPSAQEPFAGVLTVAAADGVNGAYTVSTGDIASPGRIIGPLTLSAASGAQGPILSWNSVAGRAYAIDFKNQAADPVWTPLTNLVATGSSTAIVDTSASGARLYRGRTILPVP